MLRDLERQPRAITRARMSARLTRLRWSAHPSGGRQPEFANLCGSPARARLPPLCQAKIIPYIFRIMKDLRRVPLIFDGHAL
jgi:hypothetical protein